MGSITRFIFKYFSLLGLLCSCDQAYNELLIESNSDESMAIKKELLLKDEYAYNITKLHRVFWIIHYKKIKLSCNELDNEYLKATRLYQKELKEELLDPENSYFMMSFSQITATVDQNERRLARVEKKSLKIFHSLLSDFESDRNKIALNNLCNFLFTHVMNGCSNKKIMMLMDQWEEKELSSIVEKKKSKVVTCKEWLNLLCNDGEGEKMSPKEEFQEFAKYARIAVTSMKFIKAK